MNVKKYGLVQTPELELFRATFVEHNQNLTFLLYISGGLTSSHPFNLKDYVISKGLVGRQDIAVDEWGVELGTWELWYPNEGRDIVEIMVGPAHVGCNAECLVVAYAMAVLEMQRMRQTHRRIQAKGETKFCLSMSIFVVLLYVLPMVICNSRIH